MTDIEIIVELDKHVSTNAMVPEKMNMNNTENE